MGIVSFIVDAADQGLETVAASQFAAVAGGLGTAIVIAATFAMIMLFINIALQIKPMVASEVYPLLFKIALINAFAFNWVNFNYVSGQIFDGLDNVAGMLIGSITGDSGSGAGYFADRFDQMIDDLADYANEIGSNLNWMTGAVLSVVLTVLLSVLGGAAALVLVLAKMVVTLLIGIAPAMIMMSLFRITHDYFQRWLAALVSWSFYPVVIAGVFSVIFGLMRVMQSALGGAGNTTNIGAAIPFLALISLSLALIWFIPSIVRTLSGDINAGIAGSFSGGMGRSMTRLPQSGNRPKSEVIHRNMERGNSPTSEATPRTSDLQSTGTGAKLLRMKERADRLRR